MNNFIVLFQITGFRASLFAVVVLVNVVSGVFSLISPKILGDVINIGLSSGSTKEITNMYYLIAILASGMFVQVIFSNIQSYFLSIYGDRAAFKLKEILFSKIVLLPRNLFTGQSTGEYLSILLSDTSIIKNLVTGKLFSIISQLIVFFGGIFLLISINLQLTTIMLFSFIPVLIITSIVTIRTRYLSLKIQEVLAKSTQNIQEAILNIQIVKSFTAEKLEVLKFQNTNSEIFYALKQMSLISSFATIILIFVILVFLFFASSNGFYLVSIQVLAPNQLLSFVFYSLNISMSASNLATSFAQIHASGGVVDRILSIIRKPTEKLDVDEGGNNFHAPAITFDHVYFSYGSNNSVLEDVSFSIKPSEIVALVGLSGGGKSTLINLIPRFFETSSGNIYINGENVKNISLSKLRRNCSIVTQDIMLFSGTIRENLAYGSPYASDLEIRDAMEVSNIAELVDNLDRGLDSHIGERGFLFSGGQRQRICIARAIIKKSPIIIFDEATSFLDNESEHLIFQRLRSALSNSTVFVISHRLNTLRNADRILLLHHGRIVGNGSHNLLMDKNDLYRNLYNLESEISDRSHLI